MHSWQKKEIPASEGMKKRYMYKARSEAPLAKIHNSEFSIQN
ncbi:hypothetical protein KAOT1_22181 [Kordia algicida OT-1]|uniref:Uncharacterized protein n=1 Tax=Kordia algicida OT-1 TaxID=391587 RepID=A9E1B3_9FLAO|nr:hypothetical protein KAOT1_22181 [Kordia algicida OT-1]